MASYGAENRLTVVQPDPTTIIADGAPAPYDAESQRGGDRNGSPLENAPGAGMSLTAIEPGHIATLESLSGVAGVTPVRDVDVEYVSAVDGARFGIPMASAGASAQPQVAAGSSPDQASSRFEITVPELYADDLGYAAPQEAVGGNLTLGVSDASGELHEVSAVIVGVTQPPFTMLDESLAPNAALESELIELARLGLPPGTPEIVTLVTVDADPSLDAAGIAALQARIDAQGFHADTLADQLGAIRSIVDGILLVLNAFAAVGLVAAGFGIVNTLLMSVQERTREIGLLKALGLGSARVFALFTVEALVIGLLGGALGMLAGTTLGGIANPLLADGALTGLHGLTLFTIEPVGLATTLVIVLGIALLAGTVPALRAARKDPVDALRTE